MKEGKHIINKLTFKADERLVMALDLLQKEANLDKDDVINRAIYFYLDLGGPDGEFRLKMQHGLKDIFGFNDLVGLDKVIERQVAYYLSQKEAGPAPKSTDFADNSGIDKQISLYKLELNRTLGILDNELGQGKDVKAVDVASRSGLEVAAMSRMLSHFGINSKRKEVKGERARFYEPDQLDAVKKALEDTKEI